MKERITSYSTRQLFSILSQNTGEWSVKKTIKKSRAYPAFAFLTNLNQLYPTTKAAVYANQTDKALLLHLCQLVAGA